MGNQARRCAFNYDASAIRHGFRWSHLGGWGGERLGTLTSVQKSSAERGSDATVARELEAELELYPQKRGEILGEAADAWHRAGEHDRAFELLGQALALGGEEAGRARGDLADVLFDLGRVDEAREQVAALRRDRPPGAGPYHLAGELLEDRGEYQEALVWFNMAYSRLSADEVTERRPEWGPVLQRRADPRQPAPGAPGDRDPAG
jgi:tetratricopeptide (TPR) repeat protein